MLGFVLLASLHHASEKKKIDPNNSIIGIFILWQNRNVSCDLLAVGINVNFLQW